VRLEKTNGTAMPNAWRFEAWERMSGAIVHEEDDVSVILTTCARLTDLGEENIFEPGPEDGPINKALGLWIHGQLLVDMSRHGDIGIDDSSVDYDRGFAKRSIGDDASDKGDSLA
jgi:hypothetical protein